MRFEPPLRDGVHAGALCTVCLEHRGKSPHRVGAAFAGGENDPAAASR
jgi:hypothetical protein